jgi:hypothetical protein
MIFRTILGCRTLNRVEITFIPLINVEVTSIISGEVERPGRLQGPRARRLSG